MKILKVTETGKKYITPINPDAEIVRWAFETLAKGIFTTEEVWKQARKKGLKISKHGFWVIIRNPVYCGKIFIPKYKDEEAHFVKGQHEPIISEALYYEVQDVLDGRKRKKGTQIVVQDKLPLRGFLICPRCGKSLSGSASKGKYKYYHYYHCTSSCGSRYNAANARRLMLKEEITAAEYREIKAEYQPEVESLEGRLSNFSVRGGKIDPLVNKAVDNVFMLDQLFEKGTVVEQRQIVSSIYPEKLIFDGLNYRTPRVNEVVRLICAMDAVFQGIKKGHSSNISEMSPEVTP